MLLTKYVTESAGVCMLCPPIIRYALGVGCGIQSNFKLIDVAIDILTTVDNVTLAIF